MLHTPLLIVSGSQSDPDTYESCSDSDNSESGDKGDFIDRMLDNLVCLKTSEIKRYGYEHYGDFIQQDGIYIGGNATVKINGKNRRISSFYRFKYKIGRDGDYNKVSLKYVKKLRGLVDHRVISINDLKKLFTCRIGCFCIDCDCHAEMLLRAANEILLERGVDMSLVCGYGENYNTMNN